MLNLSYKDVAEKYGGNKQKIAEAAALGALGPEGPLLAVTAGMYIDKMRAAQAQEQVPQQTVAQQVLSPQAPPTPQQGGMPPQMGAPMPPQGGMPPQMGAPAPAPAPAPGMAAGGYLPPYASGGLSDLPVPDTMFDEPSNGGYAGGGLVAFAGGDYVRAAPPPMVSETGDEMILSSPDRAKPPVSLGGAPTFDLPNSLYGYSNDFFTNLNRWKEMYSPETKQRERAAAALEESMSPEAQKRARQEDMWATLGQIGARMATTPGSVLQAAATGIGEALPGARAAAKERKAEVRSALKELAQQEGLTNQEALTAAQIAADMQGKYATFGEAMQDRAFKDRWGKEDRAVQRAANKLSYDASIYGARSSAGASMYGSRLGLQGQQYAADRAIQRDENAIRQAAVEAVNNAIGIGGPNYGAYKAAVKAGTGNQYIQDLIGAYTGASAGASAGGGNAVSVPWNP